MKQEQPLHSRLSRRSFLLKTAGVSAIFIVPRRLLGRGFTAPSDKITLGFIGAGTQGMDLRNSFHVMTQDAQIIAVSDVYKIKMDGFVVQENVYNAKKYGQASYKTCAQYNDYREMLTLSDLDAVVISTPDHWHALQTIHAAKAGKDIYCEKPLSHSVAEGRSMVNAVRQHKRILQTGSMQRSWAEFRLAAELVRNGYIGDVLTVKVNVGGPPITYNLTAETLPDNLDWDKWLGPNSFSPFNHLIAPPPYSNYYARWRDYAEFGGGGMCDWGAHMFDIAQWALDMDQKGPVYVSPPDGKELKVLTYRYENGVIMTRENYGGEFGVQFNGTKGSIEVHRGGIKTIPDSLAKITFGPGERKVYFSDNHYLNFLTCIKNRTRPVCDVETGHRTATVCNIGNIAYAMNKPLSWNYKLEKFNDVEANGMLKKKMRKEYMY